MRANEDKWQKTLLDYDIELLEREREHLTRKRLERSLTVFERRRIYSITDELKQIYQRIQPTIN